MGESAKSERLDGMDRWRSLAWKKPNEAKASEVGLAICLESTSEQVFEGLDRLRAAWGSEALGQKLSERNESRVLGMGQQGALERKSLIQEVAEHSFNERLREGAWRRVGAMLDCGADPDEDSLGASALQWCLKRADSAVDEAPWVDLAAMCLAASSKPENQAWSMEQMAVGGAVGRAIEREHAKRVAKSLEACARRAPAGPKGQRL